MEKSYSYQVEGMTCGNCALTISRLLERKGMSHISANAATGELHFTNTTETDVTDVLDAIDKLGYTVVREHAHSQEQAHDHEHGHGDNHLFLWCIILTIPLLLHMFVSWPLIHNPWFQLALSTPVLLMGFYAFGLSAWRSLLHRLPNMNVLILLGAAAAYVYSLIGFIRYGAQAHQYLFFETTASIITLVMTGNWLEQRTVKTTTASIEALARLQPAFARLLMTDSLGRETVTEVESRYVKAGDIVVVGEGDAIPVDGTVVKGNGFADEHMITGESEPVGKGTGDAVVGGTLLVQGPLRIQATTVGSASVLSGIIRIVREAQAVKPPLQKLADRISAIFVPLVALIAVLTFVVNYVWVVPFEAAMMRSIAVMVISCPCAMGLATPAAVAVGLGRAARNGILIKGGDTLERMKTLKQVVFDKTGTLTQGTLSISRYESAYLPEADFKSIVAVLESASSHPIARSVARQWSNTTGWIADGIRELKGKGMEAVDTEGHTWQLGSAQWLWQEGMPEGYDLYLLEEGRFAGALQLEDELRPDAAETIARLREMGYKTIMLSGDREEKCRQIAEHLGLDEYHARQSPEQKYEMLGRLLAQAPVAMVGDGINDAPALAKATVGISLSNATQIAIQSASVILSNNHLSSLPKAIRLGIYTDATIRQNLFWAMLYNVIAIPVAAVGLLTPTWGAGIMALSDVVLILNSLRLGVRRL